MDLVLFEDGAHGVVAADHAFVVGILEVVRADIDPYSFDSLGPRELEVLSEKVSRDDD